MKVSCRIEEVIKYLKKQKRDGYKSVELVDDARAFGWHSSIPTLEFIFSKDEPTVLGIDALTKKDVSL